MKRTLRRPVLALLLLLPWKAVAQEFAGASGIARLELRRPARPWEFVDAVGRKAALFGNEAGRLEAWVYPLKLCRDFTLRFHFKDHTVAAETAAREVMVRPESTTIVYAGASWTVHETLFTPPGEPGALVRLEIDAFEPLQVEAQFVRDFQLMWPAAIGGSFIEWDKKLGAFVMGHEEKKYAAVIGSPSTVAHELEYFSNSSGSNRNTLLLERVEKGHATQTIYLTGSTDGPAEARARYERFISLISTSSPQDFHVLEDSARQYFRAFLDRTVSLELPDAGLQAAYDWSRIGMLQGLVDNPWLGSGLIAGYRGSGSGQRPGFAWFFGRDSLWTDFALDSIGDFQTARAALEFILQYQRADGKVEHEISQTASLTSWFTNFEYPYASADATPLLILAMNDYVTASGDLEFLGHRWDNAWRAYQFLCSTYDAQGLPQNGQSGHGWVEGGPLLPVESEIYQSGLGVAALAALAHLGRLAGRPELARRLEDEYAAHKRTTNELFWSPAGNTLVFALNRQGERVEIPTVLSTAPMWFTVFDPAKANATIDQVAGEDHSTDWGMRILSNRNPLFDPAGYHFGSVWPLFTGWAALGEYEYHRPLPAYANLQANARLTFDGSLGHVAEVLSGSYYEALETGSPHQIWSSAMVAAPLLRGLLGIHGSATENKVLVAPHVPANWSFWSARNVPACRGLLDLTYRHTAEHVTLRAAFRASSRPASSSAGDGKTDVCTLTFSPGLSLHAVVGSSITITETASDKHPVVTTTLSASANPATVDIPVHGDFGLTIPTPLPSLGGVSGNLKVVRESWNAGRSQLRVELRGVSGTTYHLGAFGATISSVEGARLIEPTREWEPQDPKGRAAIQNNEKNKDGKKPTTKRIGEQPNDGQEIEAVFPGDPSAGYTSLSVTLNFAGNSPGQFSGR